MESRKTSSDPATTRKGVWKLELLDTPTLSLILAYLPLHCINALIYTGTKDFLRKLTPNGAVKVIDFAVREKSRPAIMSAIPRIPPALLDIPNFAIPKNLKTRLQGAHTLHLPQNNFVQDISYGDLPSSLTTFTCDFNNLPTLPEGHQSITEALPHLVHLGLKVGNARPPAIPNLLSSLPPCLLTLCLSTRCTLRQFDGLLPPTLATFDLKGAHFVHPSTTRLSESDLLIKLPSSLTDLRLDPYELRLPSKAVWGWTNLTLLRRFHLSEVSYESRRLLPHTITHLELTKDIYYEEINYLSKNWPPNLSTLMFVCGSSEMEKIHEYPYTLPKSVTSLRLMDRHEVNVLLEPSHAKSFFGNIQSPLSYYFGENLTCLELPEHIISETILPTVAIRKKLKRVMLHDVMLSGLSIPSDLTVLARIEDLEAPFWHYWLNQQGIPLILTSMAPLKKFLRRTLSGNDHDPFYAPSLPNTITHLTVDDHGVNLRNLPTSIVLATGVFHDTSRLPSLPHLTSLSFAKRPNSATISEYLARCPKLTHLSGANIDIPPSFFPENLHLFCSQLAHKKAKGPQLIEIASSYPQSTAESDSSTFALVDPSASQSSSEESRPLPIELNLPQDVVSAYKNSAEISLITLENPSFNHASILESYKGPLPLYEKYVLGDIRDLSADAIPSGARSVHIGPHDLHVSNDVGFPILPSSVTHIAFEGARAIIFVYGPRRKTKITERSEPIYGPTSRFADFSWIPQTVTSIEVTAENWQDSPKFTLEYLPPSVTSLVVHHPSSKLSDAIVAATPARLSERTFTNDERTFTAKALTTSNLI